MQVQIFTDLLPAAGDSLSEENQASPGGSLRESRGAKEVAVAQSNRDGKYVIVISPKTDMVKGTSRTTLIGVEPPKYT